MAKTRNENQIKKAMEALGVYKTEFDPMIKIMGQLKEQYDELTARFELLNYECSTSNGKKSPLVSTIEALRKDILAYAAQLGLTPSGLKKINDAALAPQKKANALVEALKEMQG